MSGGYGLPAFASSPPSTPGSDLSGRPGSRRTFSDFAAGPSTTPAGPPPSSARSFTPGQPPSSTFGSSGLERGQSLFAKQPKASKEVEKPTSIFDQANYPKATDLFKDIPIPTLSKSAKAFDFVATAAAHRRGFSLQSQEDSEHRGTSKEDTSRQIDEARKLREKSRLQTRQLFESTASYELPSHANGTDNSPVALNGNANDGLATLNGSNQRFASEDDQEDLALDGPNRNSYGHEENSGMDIDSGTVRRSAKKPITTGQSLFDFKSTAPYDWAAHGNSPQAATPRGIKRQRGGSVKKYYGSQRNSLPTRKPESDIPVLAKGIAKQLGPANINEPDSLILETESQISKLYSAATPLRDQEQVREAALIVVPEALSKSWQNCCNDEKTAQAMDEEFTMGIGPSEESPAIEKATFVSTVLLKLFHPPLARGKQAFAPSRTGPARHHDSLMLYKPEARLEAYPRMLLDWLEEHHNPYHDAMSGVWSCKPNVTAHNNFWDIIFSATLRGKLEEVLKLLKDADFKHARTARDDGQPSDGYHSTQIPHITKVTNRAIHILEACPGLREGDWHVSNNGWAIFRRRVEHALADLTSYAEGQNRHLDSGEPTMQAENFGLMSTSTALSRSARKAESKVPWTIYQNLKALYGVLMGGATELIALAQDWVEATISLTVWWDGNDEEAMLALSRRSMQRSQSAQILRSVDESPGAAYRQRLAYAYREVTSEDSFQINSNNAVEVALAGIFEGEIECVLGILRSWSLPITAAVIEIACMAGWYESPPAEGAVDGFNESDLLVLSYAQPERNLSRDAVLMDYAEQLFGRGELVDKSGKQRREGWEVSVQVISRLEDEALASRQVGLLLSKLAVDSDERADKLISICRDYSLVKEAAEIAGKYAATIAESSHRYGTALMYYARAHDAKRVKDVVDLLISFCLVQSIAYPPREKLDKHLSTLLSKPRDSLMTLSREDMEAAEILSTQLSGYATLRKFYDLRDDEILNGKAAALRPLARKKAAVSYLLGVIASAADKIQGGLFDESSTAVVSVDGLLVLLGEATVFIDQEPRLLKLPQILVLLRAIEDLQTVHPRIMSQCAECLGSALAAARGAAPPDPKELLKKSISDLTASTAFSLVGSSMMNSASANGNKSGTDSKKRGWDWRKTVAEGTTGEVILMHLRLGLAKEVSRAWIDGDEV